MENIMLKEDNEWIKVEKGVEKVGIKIKEKEKIGEIVLVELKEVGRKVEKGDGVVVVE